MECVLTRERSCGSHGPVQSPPPPSPAKLNRFLEKAFDERMQVLEPDIILRTQAACLEALVPQLMSRVEKACDDTLTSLEPQILSRIQPAVPSDANQSERHTKSAIPFVDASALQHVLNLSSFQQVVKSTVEQMTSDTLQRLESEMTELKVKVADCSASLAQLRESTAKIKNTFARTPVLTTPVDSTAVSEIVAATIEKIEEADHPQPDIINLPPLTRVPSRLEGDNPRELPSVIEKTYDYPHDSTYGKVVQVEGSEKLEEDNLNQLLSSSQLTRHAVTSEKQSQFQQDRVRHSDAYKLQESTWEMVIVARTGWTSLSGDIQLAIAFVVNAIMQLILAIIIWKTFSVTEDMDVDVASLEKWRVTAAHNYLNVDDIAQETLVSRVCRYDGTLGIYTNYVAILSDIDVYNEPLWPSSIGQTLCSLVVLIWVFTVVDDALDCSGFMHGIACVPRGPMSALRSISEDEFGALALEFETITHHRFAFAILVCGVRLVVALVFLLVGCKWLAHTYDFADLLLNSVALAFVFRLDELCFEVLVPIDVYTVCEVLQPLPLKIHMIRSCGKFPNWNSSDMSRIPLLFASLLFFVYIAVVDIQPRTKQLRDAEAALCGGKLNFATGYDPRTKVLYTSPTTLGHYETDWPDGKPPEIPIIGSH